jgi:hypothetical protein
MRTEKVSTLEAAEPSRAFASGRVGKVLGVLLGLMISHGTASYAAVDESTKALAKGLLVIQNKYARATNELNVHIEEVDLTRLGEMAILVKPEQRADSRTQLARFRSLVAERTALERAMNAEVDKYLNSQSANPARRAAALQAVLPLKAQAQQAMDSLTAADLAMANGLADMLDWADAQEGSLSISKGKLVFANAAQQDALLALAQKLSAAQERDDAARLAMNAFQDSRRAAVRKGRQKLGV